MDYTLIELSVFAVATLGVGLAVLNNRHKNNEIERKQKEELDKQMAINDEYWKKYNEKRMQTWQKPTPIVAPLKPRSTPEPQKRTRVAESTPRKIDSDGFISGAIVGAVVESMFSSSSSDSSSSYSGGGGSSDGGGASGGFD